MNNQSKIILQLIGIAIAVKLLIPIAGLVLAKWGFISPAGNKLIFIEFDFQNYLKSFFNSDSGWYRVIALYGYQDIPETEMQGWKTPFLHFAFFPLFPFLISCLSKLAGFDFFLSAFFVNVIILMALIRIWVKYLFHKGLDDIQVIRLSVILLLSPFSLHLFLIYTESLYLLLLIYVFYHAEKGKWAHAAIFASLMVLTRPNGIMILIPLMFIVIDVYKNQTETTMVEKIKRMPLNILFLALLPMTFMIWMFVQYKVGGDPFLFSHAQVAWNKNLMFPLLALFRSGFWDQQLMSVLVVLAILITLVAGRKWDNSHRALVWTGILLPLSAGSVISMSRYLSVLFPFYLSMSSLLKKRYYMLLVLMCIILQCVGIKWWFEDSAMMY